MIGLANSVLFKAHNLSGLRHGCRFTSPYWLLENLQKNGILGIGSTPPLGGPLSGVISPPIGWIITPIKPIYLFVGHFFSASPLNLLIWIVGAHLVDEFPWDEFFGVWQSSQTFAISANGSRIWGPFHWFQIWVYHQFVCWFWKYLKLIMRYYCNIFYIIDFHCMLYLKS